jgi:hypothetical protein
MKRAKRYLLFLLLFSFVALQTLAQKDTSRKQIVDITSSYKPVLRNAVKINFSASNLNADTFKARLQYNIPSQNLFYTYQALPLKPLALQQDTALDLGTRNFVKVGFGNYSTPYAKVGLSFGDGKTKLVNVYADYISSQGNLANQDYSQSNIKGTASIFTNANEIYGSAAINQSNYYLYGYNNKDTSFNKADIKQGLSTLTFNAGLRNKEKNGTGINYDPNIKFSFFSDQNKSTENTVVVNAPIEKTLDNVFTIKINAKADATTYSTSALPSNVTIHNNVFLLAPALEVNGQRFSLHAGIVPTWDNGQLTIFPDFYAETPIKNKIFLLQAGWTGSLIKNTYQNLSNINPYLQTINSQLNIREIEFYGGIKATVGKHFNFNAKAGLVTYHDLPLFVNDTVIGNSFYIRNESKANNFRIHGDLSYIDQDKFTVNAGLTLNGYTGLINNLHAWGYSPLELVASMRWWAYKSVLFKADLDAFGGAPYLLKNNVSSTLPGGTDLSAGVEFLITKNWSAWLDLNNLLNEQYQRWYNYPVYGLNFLAGVRYKF